MEDFFRGVLKLYLSIFLYFLKFYLHYRLWVAALVAQGLKTSSTTNLLGKQKRMAFRMFIDVQNTWINLTIHLNLILQVSRIFLLITASTNTPITLFLEESMSPKLKKTGSRFKKGL
jgi:hypothetical protein